MHLPQNNSDTASEDSLITWARELTNDDLKSFIHYRSNALGDLDDDDFELASV